MADPPSVPWDLQCPWCMFYIRVNARGRRGDDPGSGVEAAKIMEIHIAALHDRSWNEFLERSPDERPARR